MDYITIRPKSNVSVNQSEYFEYLSRKTKYYILRSQSLNTTRAYKSDWKQFLVWCTEFNLVPLPASVETVELYIAELVEQGKHTSTIQRRLTAIAEAHKAAEVPSPTHTQRLQRVWSGVRRDRPMIQRGKKPLMTEDLQEMLRVMPNTLKGLRDRALLLLGFAGALRRSELVALDREDIDISRDGVTILIRQSKTDQDGEGQTIAILYGTNRLTCPVRTLEDWIEAAKITRGPLFRRVNRWDQVQQSRLGDRMVARIVKEAVQNIGLPAERYAGHSLRAGFATSAARNGASERSIMKQTRHKSLEVARRYIREGERFMDNASSKLGL